MQSKVLVAALALFTGGCMSTGPNSLRPLPVERIARSCCREFSGLRDPARLVIREPGRFAQVWRDAYGAYEPAPPVPDVDFSRDMVIMVAMGEQRSGGNAIEVTNVVAVGSRLVVEVKTAVPGPGCATHDALTQPHDMVKVPALSAVVQFHDRSAARCP